MIPRPRLAFVLLAASAAVLVGCPASDSDPAPSAADAPVATLILEDCTLPGIDRPARCGTYEVFENRAAGTGRTIPLRVVVVPATSETPEPDPLTYFAGGPGDNAVGNAGWLVFDWAALLEHRDLVLVDARGTGESKPLMCPYQDGTMGVETALETFIPVDQVDACRETLSADADLTQYTTANIVDDIAEVIEALGYRQVNIAGGSYGTRVVQSYLRRHGETVRTALIEGAVPMDSFMPSTFARDMEAAFDGLVEECAADPACHEAFPDPRGDLEAALATVRAEPVAVEVIDAKTKETRSLRVSEAVVLQTVRYMLYDALGALQVPAFVHAAAEGEWQPLAQTAWTVAGGLMAGLPDGLYLSVVCPEDVTHIDVELAREQAEGTLLGDFRLRQQLAACEPWPTGDIPEGFHDPVVSSVPTLIVSGERDPVTPAAWGDQVGATLENSRHLVVPDGGHSYFGLGGIDCIAEEYRQLVETASVEGLDVEACAASIERPPFLLDASAPERVELGTEELARCAGTFGEKGLIGVFEVAEDGTLELTIGEETETLVPVSPSRFVAVGASPGDSFDFVLPDDGSPASAVRVVRGGSVVLELSRQE